MKEPFALIVEDDSDLSEIFREAMVAAGYYAEVIRDGLVAQERLREMTPTVVILDIHLPHVSGETLLRQIRSASHLKETRIVVATADSQAAEFLRESADLVMVKPISFVQMRDLAKRLNPALQTGNFQKPSPPGAGTESKG
jgi:DNA-binding response OmpR family regulator